MERDHRRTFTDAVLDPRQLTTIRKVKQSGVSHGPMMPAPGRLCEASGEASRLTRVLVKVS
jgi:hypothetical protein